MCFGATTPVVCLCVRGQQSRCLVWVFLHPFAVIQTQTTFRVRQSSLPMRGPLHDTHTQQAAASNRRRPRPNQPNIAGGLDRVRVGLVGWGSIVKSIQSQSYPQHDAGAEGRKIGALARSNETTRPRRSAGESGTRRRRRLELGVCGVVLMCNRRRKGKKETKSVNRALDSLAISFGVG